MNNNNFFSKQKRISFLIMGFSFLFLLSISSIYATKITTSAGQGLQVNSWTINSIKQYQNFTFVWDVSDANGMLLKANSTNCTFVTFPNGKFGMVTAGRGSITPDGNAWYFTVSGASLSVIGQWNGQVDCYLLSNSSISGNLLDSYEVTPTGGDRLNSLSIFIILIISSLSIILLGIVIGNEYIGFIGGALMIISGVYSMIYGIGNLSDTWTQAISYVIIGLGLIFEISAGYSAVAGSGLMSRIRGGEEDF